MLGDFRPFHKKPRFCKIYIVRFYRHKVVSLWTKEIMILTSILRQSVWLSKKARTAQGMTREQLARIVDYDPRHLQAIENEGQKPSLELFIQLMTMFNISVDEYIFPNKEVNKSSARRRLDAQLDNLDDKELSIVEATVNGLCKAKE